ncbi:MAG: PP2C family protein-serine/threonine phosphatase, partial [Chloroflexota bacterium]|nr:PP2C family protein-serine/threonine phosphatase [Chloroflexota bacterium]
REKNQQLQQAYEDLQDTQAQLLEAQRLEHEREVARARIEHELRLAQRIQHSLLPKEVPVLPGWESATYYQPAREVGGDFYDFLFLPGGRIGFVIGDVTDKGVPAALVMATTRSVLRGVAQQANTPGEALRQANELIVPDMPPGMFVTCLLMILDPTTGQLHYANAGHNLPYRRHPDGVEELRARGMPLGLMPGMHYEEREGRLLPGDTLILYSDGLVEAHSPRGEMFGDPRLQRLLWQHGVHRGTALIDCLLRELEAFTGSDWEQEDDITLVTLQRAP